jgi:hypothetical protein
LTAIKRSGFYFQVSGALELVSGAGASEFLAKEFFRLVGNSGKSLTF